jgi:DNA-binding protein Fis
MIEQLLGQTIPKTIEVSDKEILEYVEKHLKDQVREEVREEKVNQAIEKYVNDLRGKAQVEVLVKKAP